jgi:hypothetical protein
MVLLARRLTLDIAIVFAVTAAACSRSGDSVLDSSVASVAKTAGAAEQSAGLVTQYPPPADSAMRWTFDSMTVGEPPRDFLFGRTGDGRPGRWIVQGAENAPSRPNVLVQSDTDRTSDRFPIAVAEHLTLRDLALSVRCKTISGKVDQACGLVFRYRDENNYLVTRANSLEDNVRLYYVKDGRRREIASWRGTVTRGEWHTLAVRAFGDRIEVSWDGKPVILKQDDTFKEVGRVGVWLKADSYTEYDDLTVTPLTASGAPR